MGTDPTHPKVASVVASATAEETEDVAGHVATAIEEEPLEGDKPAVASIATYTT